MAYQVTKFSLFNATKDSGKMLMPNILRVVYSVASNENQTILSVSLSYTSYHGFDLTLK